MFFFYSAKTERPSAAVGSLGPISSDRKEARDCAGGRCQELCVIPADMSHRAGGKSLGRCARSYLAAGESPLPVSRKNYPLVQLRSQSTRCLTAHTPSSSSVPSKWFQALEKDFFLSSKTGGLISAVRGFHNFSP